MTASHEQLAERLRGHVQRLASAPRPPRSREHEQARAYIRGHLESSGFRVEEFTDREDDWSCINLLTRPLPEDDRLPLVVIGAHYDSIPTSPGADDNASAVAALIELARWIGPRLRDDPPTGARLQLAAYDLEEYGMVGSWLHAKEIKKKRIPLRGMISLEMLGYIDHRPGSQKLPPVVKHLYPDVGDFIGVCGNEASQDLLQVVTQAMRSVPGLPVEHIAVPGNGELLPETRLSDHSSFWDHGYAALMVTDTSFYRNPHYHQPSDTAETLDYPFLAKVTAGVCEAASRLLQ
jgi:Zn-dependent M28 family amino/carboxypeptidase